MDIFTKHLRGKKVFILREKKTLLQDNYILLVELCGLYFR